MIPVIQRIAGLEAAMMGRRSEQWSLFYQFRLDERVPKDHLLRRIDEVLVRGVANDQRLSHAEIVRIARFR